MGILLLMVAPRSTKHILHELANCLPEDGPPNLVSRIDINSGIGGTIFVEIFSGTKQAEDDDPDRSIERSFRSALTAKMGHDWVFVHWHYPRTMDPEGWRSPWPGTTATWD